MEIYGGRIESKNRDESLRFNWLSVTNLSDEIR